MQIWDTIEKLLLIAILSMTYVIYRKCILTNMTAKARAMGCAKEPFCSVQFWFSFGDFPPRQLHNPESLSQELLAI